MSLFKSSFITAALVLSVNTAFASSFFGGFDVLADAPHLKHSHYAFRTMVQMGREDAVCSLCILMEKHTHAKDKADAEIQADASILDKIPTQRLIQAYDAAERVQKSAHTRETARYADLRHFPVLDESHISGFTPRVYPYVALLVNLEKCDLYRDSRLLFDALLDPTYKHTERTVSDDEAHMAVADWSLQPSHKLCPLLMGAYHWDGVCFASHQVFKDFSRLEDDPLQTTLLLISELPICLSSHLLKGKKGQQNLYSAQFRGLERAQLTLRRLRMD